LKKVSPQRGSGSLRASLGEFLGHLPQGEETGNTNLGLPEEKNLKHRNVLYQKG